MGSYFAYIRVSTAKQGEGASLTEQRASIEAFAQRNDLHISEWFEELETAAKQGRTAFNRMLAQVERGRSVGVIIHKIDRSARNLKDWARLGDLIDRGVEVHFAHESLDMRTRGGRLAADLQAVVAADFIRNLRDEVKKGITDAFLDGDLDRDVYAQRKAEHLRRRAELNDAINAPGSTKWQNIAERFEHGLIAKTLFDEAGEADLRELLSEVSSNISVRQKRIEFSMRQPFAAMREFAISNSCEANQDAV